MAHALNTMDGADVRIIRATVRGWILARLLTAPLTVRRMVPAPGLSTLASWRMVGSDDPLTAACRPSAASTSCSSARQR